RTARYSACRRTHTGAWVLREPLYSTRRAAAAGLSGDGARQERDTIIGAVPPAPDRPPEPLLPVLIANWNTASLIERCVNSILAHVTVPLELIVVDNGSTDGSLETLRRLAAGDPRLRLVLNPGNYGYAHANNQACAVSRAPWLALLNSDL